MEVGAQCRDAMTLLSDIRRNMRRADDSIDEALVRLSRAEGRLGELLKREDILYSIKNSSSLSPESFKEYVVELLKELK